MLSLAIICPFEKLPPRILGATRQRINIYINNKFKVFQMVAWKNRKKQNKTKHTPQGFDRKPFILEWPFIPIPLEGCV